MANLDIKIVKGVGVGETELSAFDSALKDAGVYNYNIIQLSSIIPPGSTVTEEDSFQTPDSEFGHKLYVVKAEQRSKKAGNFIAAGVGWYQLEGQGGKGLFVEHEIEGETEQAVESEIKLRIDNSLKDLCLFRDISFDEANLHKSVSITQVKDHPACTLVLAVFQSEGWR